MDVHYLIIFVFERSRFVIFAKIEALIAKNEPQILSDYSKPYTFNTAAEYEPKNYDDGGIYEEVGNNVNLYKNWIINLPALKRFHGTNLNLFN